MASTEPLAGACVAPVVIQVIVYSSDQYARGTEIALALPFFLGLGMALPWPFAGAGLSFLPRPGRWMVRVKQGMGLLILAFAADIASDGCLPVQQVTDCTGGGCSTVERKTAGLDRSANLIFYGLPVAFLLGLLLWRRRR